MTMSTLPRVLIIVCRPLWTHTASTLSSATTSQSLTTHGGWTYILIYACLLISNHLACYLVHILALISIHLSIHLITLAYCSEVVTQLIEEYHAAEKESYISWRANPVRHHHQLHSLSHSLTH